jgi:ParB family chromosome partitioning protein
MKKALGKGIKAFIPEEYGILKDETYSELEIDQIRPNPLQPRTKFDEASIDELARSIKESGVLQPIIVVSEEGHYKILIGERRWRAARKAGLKKVPALIRNIPKEHQLEISLIENLQREELNPIEISLGYKRLIDELGYTQENVAEKVGKDRASVANHLRLLKLSLEVQDLLSDGKISMGHAKVLLGLEDPQEIIALARKIMAKGLSVRDVEALLAKARKDAPAPKKAKTDPNLEAVQEDLLRVLGTKVTIDGTPKRGVIKVFYFSLGELNRVIELIKGPRT